MSNYHNSVLAKEVLDYLVVEKGEWYLDCTLGDGGHSLAILESGGQVVGLDQDVAAIGRTRQRFEEVGIDSARYQLIKGNFRDLAKLVNRQFKGVLFDLGVSSRQLDEAERGFSFSKPAVLDMRMDQSLTLIARDLVNGLNKGELIELFSKYGDLSDKRVAEAIIKYRLVKPIDTTTELAEIIAQVVGFRKGVHPATTVFQAFRMAVNDEVNSLKAALGSVLEVLEDQGKVVVISFHSIEDRLVKRQFKDWSEAKLGQILTKKPILPSEGEVRFNPRARSAKLRVFEKNYA